MWPSDYTAPRVHIHWFLLYFVNTTFWGLIWTLPSFPHSNRWVFFCRPPKFEYNLFHIAHPTVKKPTFCQQNQKSIDCTYAQSQKNMPTHPTRFFLTIIIIITIFIPHIILAADSRYNNITNTFTCYWTGKEKIDAKNGAILCDGILDCSNGFDECYNGCNKGFQCPNMTDRCVVTANVKLTFEKKNTSPLFFGEPYSTPPSSQRRVSTFSTCVCLFVTCRTLHLVKRLNSCLYSSDGPLFPRCPSVSLCGGQE